MEQIQLFTPEELSKYTLPDTWTTLSGEESWDKVELEPIDFEKAATLCEKIRKVVVARSTVTRVQFSYCRNICVITDKRTNSVRYQAQWSDDLEKHKHRHTTLQEAFESLHKRKYPILISTTPKISTI